MHDEEVHQKAGEAAERAGHYRRMAEIEEAGDEFLTIVTQTVKDWAFREVTEDLKILYSQLRENAVAQGAASLVTRKIFARLW